ncbi:MAG: NADH-quinone oxidoreductase subunit H, partial [Nitrospirae bacterium]|nr:NADH-quinone oxidoreductase subunit H [Nitrospirota bacterium]
MTNLIIIIIKIAIVISITLLHVAYVVYFERKVIGHTQARLGPMRVGPHGLLQPIADGIKLFFKEDIIPSQADKPIFYIAPVIGLVTVLSSLAVIPFWSGFSIADINIGVLYILALSSVGA